MPRDGIALDAEQRQGDDDDAVAGVRPELTTRRGHPASLGGS
jgi:hypothetical protein